MENRFVTKGLPGMALITVVLLCGFLILRKNISPILDASVTEEAPVLGSDLSTEDFASYLISTGYVGDRADAQCISSWIISHIGSGPIKNLGALNKDPFRIPVGVVDSLGGQVLRMRSDASRFTLGQDDEFHGLDYGSIGSSYSVGEGCYSIPIRILEENPSYTALSGFKGRILKRIYRTVRNDYYVPVEGVVIRVSEHDDLNRDGVPVGYMRTDASGRAVFTGAPGHYYSLIPIESGYEFGSSVGTRGMDGGLDHDFKEVTRIRRTHTIRLFDTSVYSRIKEDHSIVVRSASSYQKTLWTNVLLFIAAWWAFFIIVGIVSSRKERRADFLLPLLLFAITGIDVLCMFSIADPLTDSVLGKDMVAGTLVGLFFMGLLSMINWERFYYIGAETAVGNIEFDFVLQFLRYLERPFMEKVSFLQEFTRSHRTGGAFSWALVQVRYYVCLLLSILFLPLEWIVRAVTYFPKKYGLSLPKGAGYLVLVLIFIILLALFGDGPEGSGTKVNLFFFQPSELNKYLVVIFMAAFFCRNASRIQTFSSQLSVGSVKMQVRTVMFIFLAIGLLLVLYMTVMSDMGPALVILVTFILIYSIARKDVGQMILGVATYLLLVFIMKRLSIGTLAAQVLALLVWGALWIAGGFVLRKRLYESAIFFNLLLFAFISGGDILVKLGMENEGQRLLDRQSVAESLWNNDVKGGGDQVVQGIWSLATGGLTGQGLGKGDPNLVPAFNTDMIFTSIGEEMGFVALVLLIVCMAILLHRCLIIGYWSGDSFLFFVSSGVAIVTGVQFFIIVLGSLGVIALTGVAVPFLSYGMTSLILNLAGMGILLSISGKKVEKALQDENASYSDSLATTSVWGFLVLSLVVIVLLFNYQSLRRDHFLVEPAYVCNDQGIKLQEYNPRIRRLLRKLDSGNIYDRNGLLLATSNRGDLESARGKMDSLFVGTSVRNILSNRSRMLEQRYLKRYYPLGDYLFFMTGDVNTMTLWGIDDNNPYGYLAEERHQAQLVGFETAMREDGQLVYKKFDAHQSVSPFLPSIDTSYSFVVRNYSNRKLLRMLKQGTSGRAVRKWNESRAKRDLYLSIDARLQTLMEERMRTEIPSLQDRVQRSLDGSYKTAKGQSKPNQKVRASAVVLDVRTGDLLTSAVYPLPDQDTIRYLLNRRMDYLRYEREPSSIPFTDRDLGLTFQTQPGSTAKVMSTIAAFNKLGDDAEDVTYTITTSQGIHDRAGTYNLRSGLVSSINGYFVNLVQDHDLYPELDSIYQAVGHRIGDDRSATTQKSYFFDNEEFARSERTNFNRIVDEVRGRAIPLYRQYVAQHSQEKMNYGDWGWAWGQGTLDASPLGMARVASVVAGEGELTPTRYVLAVGSGKRMDICDVKNPIRVMSRRHSEILSGYMRQETDTRRTSTRPLPHSMGGKTGTPERSIKFMDDFGDADRFNDAWYMCFVDVIPPHDGPFAQRGNSPRKIAIAVRLERTYKFQSGEAATFVSSTVVPSLRDAGYQVIDER